MKRNTPEFYMSLIFLLYPTLAFTEDTQIVEAGKTISLNCVEQNDVDVTWKKNKDIFVRRSGNIMYHKNKPDPTFQIVKILPSTSLEISNVQLSDGGDYTCEITKKEIKSIKLIVFNVFAIPSPDVIMTENLQLHVRSSMSNHGFSVAWTVPYNNNEKDLQLSRNPLEVKNLQLRHEGLYTCHIKINGENKATFTKHITVLGYSSATEFVYTSGSPVTLPWEFNFGVRGSSLVDGVAVKSGAVYYSLDRGRDLKMLTNLSVTSDICWCMQCPKETPRELKKDLSYHLPKPRGGWYRMEIDLELKKRNTLLFKDTCLAEITVSYSPNETLTFKSHITLTCNVSCMPAKGVLHWYKDGEYIGSGLHGQHGQKSLEWELDVAPTSMGTWNCSLVVEGQTMAHNSLVLEVTSLQDLLIWTAIGGAAILFLIAALIITLAVARCRRRRRARYRAWLIQALHQQRRCECESKGFIPKRLQEEH